MKKITVLFLSVSILLISSCAPNLYVLMTPEKMEQLELGMTQQQVINILGNKFSISDKHTENNDEYTTLSYREIIHDDEFYLFEFKNDALIRWTRELLPQIKAEE